MLCICSMSDISVWTDVLQVSIQCFLIAITGAEINIHNLSAGGR